MRRPDPFVMVWALVAACLLGIVYAAYRAERPQLVEMAPVARTVAPIQVTIYVYRAEDVGKVLSAAKAALPALEGAEGAGR